MPAPIRLSNPCGECLLGDCKNAASASGKKSARFLVVCPPPTAEVVRVGRNLPKTQMETFGKAMKRQGFSKDDFVFVNAIRCPFKPDEVLAVDRNKIVKPCREYLLRVIEKMRPEVIISLGALAAKQVVNRAVKITKARGVPTWNEEHNAWSYPMLDPGYVNLYPQHKPTFTVDCKTLRGFVDSNYVLDEMNRAEGTYELSSRGSSRLRSQWGRGPSSWRPQTDASWLPARTRARTECPFERTHRSPETFRACGRTPKGDLRARCPAR